MSNPSKNVGGSLGRRIDVKFPRTPTLVDWKDWLPIFFLYNLQSTLCAILVFDPIYLKSHKNFNFRESLTKLYSIQFSTEVDDKEADRVWRSIILLGA